MNKLVIVISLLVLVFPQDQPQNNNDNRDREQQQYFQDYAKYMDQYQATQIFQFHMLAHDYEEFTLDISEDVDKVRGLYYVETDEDKNLLVWMERNGQHLLYQINKKMHVFSLENMKKGEIKIFFKNMNEKKDIFFTYQLMSKSKSNSVMYNHEMLPLIEQYRNLTQQVQNSNFIIKTMITGNIHHSQKLLEQRQSTVNYAIFEMIILLVSAAISLGLLYRIIQKGYTSII